MGSRTSLWLYNVISGGARSCCVRSVLLGFVLGAQIKVAFAQSPSVEQRMTPYKLSVSVNEVSLTFRATDAQSLPVKDLRSDEVDVFDNEKGPCKIVAFQLLQGDAIHLGILVDTSASVTMHLARSRGIAVRVAQRLSLNQEGSAFVAQFDRAKKIVQSWTNNENALVAAVKQIGAGPMGGTSIYDTLLTTCLYEFGKLDSESSRNLVLLFSDGEDTASYASLGEAIRACQQAKTAIYIFAPKADADASSGPSTLAQIAAQTGGHVFRDDESETEIHDDLEMIEGNLRYEYRLIYRPPQLRHDGSFHSVVVVGPQRVAKISVQSGYYAATQ